MPSPVAPSADQVAALPYRRKGDLEILLITSRETRRWVIPKGWPMEDRSPARAAEREAFEEAGLKGEIKSKPLGAYSYVKQKADGEAVDCRVAVFPMQVRGQAKDWPEKGQRELRWFRAAEAAEAVDEPELRDLIRRFAAAA